ncbi:MAG: outer membrane beta-barrel protein [Bacteroidales bacterium]
MKKIIVILFFSWISFNMLQAQNSIGVQVGFLGTHTSVAEYERIARQDHLLDSVDLKPDVGSVQAAVNVDFDLGKNFFLSTGFHYARKGLANVTFTDSIGWLWSTAARQNYMGISMLLGYHFHPRNSKIGLQLAAGPQVDFAVGTPNPGALFSAPYYRFFMPFSRFNEVDFSWVAEAGATYKAGPGNIVVKLSYKYGMSDVLEDAFIVARTMSYGVTVGYSLRLSK